MSAQATRSKQQVSERSSVPQKPNRTAPAHSEGCAHPATHRAHAAAQSFHDREELAVQLLPLVKRVALEIRERLPQHVDLEDLAGAGVLGLLDAVRKFDARKHVKVETYARHRIRGAILDSLREMDTASREMRKKNKSAEKTYRELQVKLGRPATDEEMAQALGVTLQRWHRTLQELNSVGVDWMRPNHVPEACILDESSLPAEGQEDPFDACYRNEQMEILRKGAELLPERERTVISLYYESELTMKQIGDRLGIDESRVSQLHSAAISHLRAKVRTILRAPSQAAVPAFAATKPRHEAALSY
jgi:RNA polymerase sigma factor FliA